LTAASASIFSQTSAMHYGMSSRIVLFRLFLEPVMVIALDL
jgi:hypothetical protein